MTEQTPDTLDPEVVRLAAEVALHVEDYLSALQAIATDGDPGSSVPLLLLQLSQISLTGARLGARVDFKPHEEYQPDVGPEPEVDDLRMRLAEILGGADTYSFVFDPYRPEMVESQLSDDLVAIATDLENGLRHLRAGNVDEALWWWQFSYVSSWGNLAGAALNALWSVVHHDRLDVDVTVDDDQVEAANELLGRVAVVDPEPTGHAT
jgi:hypothetical protein